MARTGQQKFTKYFCDREVQTYVKDDAPLYEGEQKVGFVSKGTQILVLKQDTYSPRYHIQLNDGSTFHISERFVAKPHVTFGATENLKLKTADLVKGGETRQFQGTEVAWFDDPSKLKQSIMDGIAANPNIDKVTFQVIGKIVDAPSERIQWDDIPSTTINEIGKYLGELFPFLVHDVIPGRHVQSVAYPTSTNFPNLDSFLVLDGNEVIGVSSKFGQGAKASLFNLIYTPYFDNCVYQRVAETYLDLERKIDTIYSVGFTEILNKPIENPAQVYQSIVANVHEPILDDIKSEVPTEYIASWPQSLSSFFCRSIAAKINQCSVSMNMINKTVNQKKIVQIHLDTKKWKDGTVHLLAKQFNASTVQVVGNKSAIHDVKQKQGMLNYVIR